MPTLILYLPAPSGAASPPGVVRAAPEFAYVVLRDDGHTVTQGRGLVSLLPAPARGMDVVLVLPVQTVSWHALPLPDKVAASVLSTRTDPQRARSMLAGAMEDVLLDDPQHLHLAAFPGPGGNASLWVAACERAWLRSAVATLEAGGYALSRIVAECEPLDADAGTIALVNASAQPAQFALSTAAGVTVLPLGEAAALLARNHAVQDVLAEPAVMGLAEQTLGVPAQAHTVHQSMVRAARSGRNLAQRDFSPSRSGRFLKRVAGGWQLALHAPRWRPVRWGLLALVVSQVVALHAAAYRQEAILAGKRAAMEAVLLQTFPKVPVVVNAPLQMQREVDALAQSRGAGEIDVARLLSAVGAAGGNAAALTALDLAGGELRLRGTALSDASAAALNHSIGPQGWQVRVQGDQWVLQRKEGN